MSLQNLQNVLVLESENKGNGNDNFSLHAGEFPIEALNPIMRQIAEETANVHQIPIELTAMATVATVAGAMGNSFMLKEAVNGKDNFANVFVVASAPKSTGKGAASVISKPLLNASKKMTENFYQNELPKLKADEKILKKKEEAFLKQIASGKGKKGSFSRQPTRKSCGNISLKFRANLAQSVP